MLNELHRARAKHFAAEFVQRFPGAVQALAAEAHNQAEASAVQELGSQALSDLPRLQARLEQELLARLNPLKRAAKSGLLDFERLSLTPAEEAEEQEALASLAISFADATGETGVQAQALLSRAARRLAMPALADALSDAAPSAALMASLRAAGVSLAARLLAMRPLESLALPLWSRWVEAAAQLFRQPAMVLPDAAARVPAVAGLSAAALASLKAVANSQDAGTDSLLAEVLLRAVDDGHSAGAAFSAFQDWFEAIKAEPALPASFHGEWENLRFGLAKAALHDSRFFTQAEHGLRSKAGALCLQAALTLPGLAAPIAVRTGFRELLAEANINAGEVLAALEAHAPLTAAELFRFAAHARREAKGRLTALLVRVRNAALEYTGETSLMPVTQPVASGGLMPILATAWLRDGRGSAAERAALALIAQWRDSLRPACTALARSSLRQGLQAAWAELGADALRIESLTRLLDAAWREANSSAMPVNDTENEITALLRALDDTQTSQPAPPEVPKPAAQDADRDDLSRLFAQGRWLRIASGSNGAARFLSVGYCDTAKNTVSLVSATGEPALIRPADALLGELLAGNAELLSPDREALAALERLKVAALNKSFLRVA